MSWEIQLRPLEGTIHGVYRIVGCADGWKPFQVDVVGGCSLVWLRRWVSEESFLPPGTPICLHAYPDGTVRSD